MTDETLFIAALEKPTPDERRAFLEVACADDPAQRQRLDDLLAGHDRAAGILDQPDPVPTPLDGSRHPTERPGGVLADRYKLLEAIGAGGMGTVWVAEQTRPVRRKVAVKLVKAGMDSKQVLARFEAERQALAVMDHPHIAKVLDGGTTDAGRPFLVMEYVKGVPLTAFCDDARLSIADRLALFVPVCQAVQHAHQKGIIHRDLKPTNILVCLCDGKPVPKVIDFGLAKATHEPLTDRTLHTAHGQMLGTPLYMSPEQAEFDNLDVDTRADVYALGVVLYELLTGTTPLERDQLRRAAWDEMLRLIREEEPPRPSARLSGSGSLPGVAAQRQLEPVRLTKLVRGELDWIVMKCLEKDRGRRYDTANGLARDLERYLADEPVEACPPSTAYRVKKFARRHRRGLAAASLFILLLVASVATLAAVLVTVDRERRAKETALDDKEAALQAEGKRRKQARAALDAMTSQFTADWLAKQPALTPEHRQFLEDALRWYEEFASDTGQDEDARAGVAQAYWQVGKIRESLAEWKGAEAAFARCRELYASLVADFRDRLAYRDMHAQVTLSLGRLFQVTGRPREAEATLNQSRVEFQRLVDDAPGEAEYQLGLGGTLNQLGILFNDRGLLREAEDAYGQALGVYRRLLNRSPTNRNVRYHLASTLTNLGDLRDVDGRRREAEESYRQVVEVSARLVAEDPTTPRYLQLLATARSNLAVLLWKAGADRLAAATVFRQSLEGRRKLVADFPAVTEYRQELAQTVNNLGLLLRDTGRAADAEACFSEAADVHKKLAAGSPKIADHQNDAAGALGNLAGLLLARREPHAARRLLEEAVPYHRQALAADRDHQGYRQCFRNNRWRLTETLLELGEHAAAAACTAEFLRYATEPPRDHYTAAGFLARCVRLVGQDDRLTEAERQEMTNSYGTRAVAALRQAVELKARVAAQMKADPTLKPLRSRDDYKALVAESPANTPTPREALPPPRKQ